MNEPQIVCPQCRAEIKLTESLAAPLVAETRERYERQIAAKEADFAERESALRRTREDLAKAREAIDQEVATKLRSQRASIAESEARKARIAVADDLEQRDKELAQLRHNLTANNAKLAQAQQAQADVLRKQRELDDERRELDLNVEKKVQESLAAVRAKARLDAEEGLQSRLLEKEIQISGMQRQIEDLRRRAEQRSEQAQGEAVELAMESLLRGRFPLDLIEPVPKGEFGGDILHRVRSPTGQTCGTILWETKRTKGWSDGWLAKLRDDQRRAKAEIALIVSTALPKGVDTFDLVDDVWVANPRFALPLAIALRQSLVDIAGNRRAQEGQQTKMGAVYRYLTGPRFRHRIDAIVEKFTDMREDLDRERKVMNKLWARREEQLGGVLDSTAGLYGDLQGIVGRAMQEIASLNILLIETESLKDPSAPTIT
jgi:hypothetical protein